MTDLLLQAGLSNLVLSLVLAAVAWGVHAFARRPLLAHLLWVLVLVKLVTPPLVALPGVPLPEWASGVTPERAVDSTPTPAAMPVESSAPVALHALPEPATPSEVTAIPEPASAGHAPAAVAPSDAAPVDTTASSIPWSVRVSVLKPWLAAAWLTGSAIVLAFTLVRVFRFGRLLRRATTPAPPEVQRLATQLSRQLGLRYAPAIVTTPARLSPLVWWAGGPVRVVLPEVVVDADDPARLRWVLAHELAHIRRRDHWVRWVEWLAVVLFWWNPVAWWARRNLRASEEVCCDALVLQRFASPKDTPNTYADAILSVVESLATPALRPPAIASEISSGGTLQRRFEMILSSKTTRKTPRWATTAVLLGAVGLLPLGLAQANTPAPKQDRHEAHKEKDPAVVGPMLLEEIRAAVQAGDITPEEARRKAQEIREWMARTQDEDVDHDRDEAHEDDDEQIEAQFAQLGFGEDDFDLMLEFLAKHGVGRVQMVATLRGVLHIAHGIHDQGEDFDMDEEDKHYFMKEVGLDEAQIEAVVLLAEKVVATYEQREHEAHGDEDVDIAGYFQRLGVGEEAYARIVAALDRHGVSGLQMEPTLSGLFHTVLAVREHGAERAIAEIDAEAFFSEYVGLDQAQIELVAGLALRIAAGLEEGDRDRARDGDGERRDRAEARERRERERGDRAERRERERDRDRAERDERRDREAERDAAEASGVAHELYLAQVIAELKAAVDSGRLSTEEAEEKLAALRQQIAEREARVERLITERRAEARQRAADRERATPATDKIDPEAVRDNLRAAVEAGDVTEEQARQRLARLREHLIHQVELALEAEEITREEARAKVEAIHAMTALREGDRRGR